jgi:hypothetical protein
MTIAIGDPVSGGTAHSILFVGPGTVLAQDSANFTWNSTNKILFVNGSGAKTGSFTAMNTGSTATSSTSNAQKTALSVTSIGTWNGTNAENRALYARASGGPADANYAGFFDEGDVVLNKGRLGAQVLKPSARLHVAAGSATPGTAAFKLNAGAKLTTPEAGAIEFDGTYAFITRSNGTRRLLTNNVVSVLDFGAVGDGTTNDRDAFQNAVDFLEPTGGVVWVPPELIYRINSSVDIQSNYPIFIASKMYFPRGIAYIQAPSATGYIRPGDNITNGLFRWHAVAGAQFPFLAGGGGLLNVCIADQDPQNQATRNYAVDAAVYVEGASYFVIRDCVIQSIKGSGLKLGTVTVCNMDNSVVRYCGFIDETTNPDTPYPAIQIGTINYAALWLNNCVVEGNQDAPSCHVVSTYNSLLRAHNSHFEGGNGQLFIDGDGEVHVDFCNVGSNTATSIHLKRSISSISNCIFRSNPTAETILVDAERCRLSNLFLITGQSGPSITFTANADESQASGLWLRDCGRIDATAATGVQLSDIVFYQQSAALISYAIDLGPNQLSNAYIDGFGTSTCHGIRTSSGSVTNCVVKRLNGKNGFTTTDAAATLVANQATDLGAGTAFVYTAGNVASANRGYPTTVTTNASLVATLNAESGEITTTSLSTASAAFFTVALFNSLVSASSRVLVRLKEGTNTKYPIVLRGAEFPTGGGVWITGDNASGAALDGSVKIVFEVVN